MEFSLFAHMERIDEEQSQKRLYDEFVELCQIADRSGFKTIWNGEHHGMNFTIAPNPMSLMVSAMNPGVVCALSYWTSRRFSGKTDTLIEQGFTPGILLTLFCTAVEQEEQVKPSRRSFAL